MSGDLKDPGKSLPLGTFAAVGLSIVVYFLSSLLFAAALPAEVLMSNYGAMKKVALFSSLIAAGVIAATLSSAMASFLGGPRILQSLAADKIQTVVIACGITLLIRLIAIKYTISLPAVGIKKYRKNS